MKNSVSQTARRGRTVSGITSSEAQSRHGPWVGSSVSPFLFSHGSTVATAALSIVLSLSKRERVLGLGSFFFFKKTCTVLQLRPITGIRPRTNSLSIIMIYTLGLRRLTFPEHMEETTTRTKSELSPTGRKLEGCVDSRLVGTKRVHHIL